MGKVEETRGGVGKSTHFRDIAAFVLQHAKENGKVTMEGL